MAHSHSTPAGGQNAHHGPHHEPIYYIKIWGILLFLLILSIMGPMIGVKWITIVTAFGIALVKAAMVAAFFMHLNVEKRYVWYMLFGMLAMVGMFWFGTVVDVNHDHGSNWVKISVPKYIEEFTKVTKAHDEELEREEAGGESEPANHPAEHAGEGEKK